MIANIDRYPLRAIRQACLDCCADNSKAVTYCPCDGHNSTRCGVWFFRFGVGPDTAGKRYGRAIVTPELMPSPDVGLEELPSNPADYCATVEALEACEAASEAPAA